MKRDGVEKKHWVVKIGSGVLLRDDGTVDEKTVHDIVESVEALRAEGVTVTLISSGAVALGRHALPNVESNALPHLQALAAIGQSKLMRLYEDLFADATVAQILLTRGDFNDRRRINNARLTLEQLHRLGIVPIVNENDTVANEELRFGDNDELAAMTAYLVKADILVVLSVAPGVCEVTPNGEFGDVIPEVPWEDASEADGWVLDTKSESGRGGMRSKFAAARFAGRCHVPTVIASGKVENVLLKIRAGQLIGTYFHPSKAEGSEHRRFYKSWMRISDQIEGAVIVDEGAKSAIVDRGASLLPVGIRGVEGDFTDSALIALKDQDGEVFARGVSVYSSADVRRIIGLRSERIEQVLGYYVLDTVVHRDGLVVL